MYILIMTMDIVSYLYSLCTVRRYCQKLPSDRYAILAPDFSYEVRGAKFDCFKDEHAMDATPAQCDGDERTFKCVLALPMNSPVHDPIAVSLQCYRCDMHIMCIYLSTAYSFFHMCIGCMDAHKAYRSEIRRTGSCEEAA